jgi:ligand-binding sensor domain-containing protein/two-component sensor histidine kinase
VRKIILSALIAVAVPPHAAAERLALRTYGVADGLPQEGVKRIVRDSRGFLWFCTFDGLSRFDGTRFVNYGVRDGLPHPSINDLLESRRGVYWVATNGGGVARFDPATTIAIAAAWKAASVSRPAMPVVDARGVFKSYLVGSTPAQSRVNVLHEDRAGRVWAGTDDGLFVVDDWERPTAFRQIDLPFPRPLQVWALLEDRAGCLWIGTSEGLARRLPARTEFDRVDPGEKGAVWTLAEDAEARLWVGLSTGLRIVRALPDSRSAATAAPAGINARISWLQASDQGRMWVGTLAGDVFLAGGNGVRRVLHVGDALTSLAEDHRGNLWVSTMRGRVGASKLVRYGFTSYDEADGLAAGPVVGVVESSIGELSVLTPGRLHRFDGRHFSELKPLLEGPVTIRSLLRDRRNETWVSTDRGLYRFGASTTLANLAHVRPAARYAAPEGLPTGDVMVAFEDSRGDIWIGSKAPTTIAVLRRASNQIQVVSQGSGLPALTIPSVFGEDRAGNIWIGFREGGLVRYRDGHLEHFSESRGFPRGEVLALFFDHLGRLWIADGVGALVRVDDPAAEMPSFTRYTTADGLASDIVRCVTEDLWGRMYIGTVRGIDRLDPARGHMRHFSTADGLAADQLLQAFRDRRGVLWFGSSGGLSRLHPEPEQESDAPAAFISGVRAGGRPYPISEMGERSVTGLTLQHDDAQVAIEFFGVDAADGDQLRFEYRLDGADQDWNPSTAERTVNYAHLSPGAYRFQVRALTPSGATSAKPASVSFLILPPIWLRWWFIGSACALLAGLGTLLYRYRVAQLVAIERVRTRIATDLHDDIGASLSQIAILSELVRGETDTQPESANTLDRIASISRDLVESMGDIVWAINPRRDRVGDLLQRMRHFASDTLTGKDIDFSFQAPRLGRELVLAADARREVLLIFKEAVNNIVQHARCHHVDIDVRIDREGLVLQVADDGDGLRLASDRQDGHGLLSMRERAARLAGSLEVGSASGGGTTVLLRVPLRRAPHTYLRT